MKIKVKEAPIEKVLAIKNVHKNPIRQSVLLKRLVELLGKGDLSATHFSYVEEGMEKLAKDEPCLILMNHSSFIDLEIAFTIFKDRLFNIICTSDGFVGKEGLLRHLGCVPTQKFVTDLTLVKDMIYITKELKSSILLYPEASYSFDGTATNLPDSLGKMLKVLNVPVVMVKTEGAFARDPLYNNLQIRQVDVSAKVSYILSPEDIAAKSVNELNAILKDYFTFDNFKWQQENNIKITEKFRADSLNRVLYKCPACKTEGKMLGAGTVLFCKECGKKYELTEEGFMSAIDGETEIAHIPDWYKWERENVRAELENGTYRLDIPVDIYVLTHLKCLYKVGDGRLVHTANGFELKGCDGKLEYSQKPKSSYSLYSDYFWYEIGDMICIGTPKVLYYCFPKESGDVVAKTRLAAEELYKMVI